MKKNKINLQFFSTNNSYDLWINKPWTIPKYNTLSWNFSKLQYKTYDKDTKIIATHNGNKYIFGYVVEDKETSSGMNYKVIISPDKNTHTLMLAGTNFTSWKDDLSDLNYAHNGTSGQAEDAYNKIVEQFKSNKNNPNFHLFITGHSLGGMNLQRAVAKFALKHPKEAKKIYGTMFETPNVYKFLSPLEKIAINGLRSHFKNYTKSSDIVNSGFGLLKYDLRSSFIGERIELKSDWNVITSKLFSRLTIFAMQGFHVDIFSLFENVQNLINKVLDEHMLSEEKNSDNYSIEKVYKYDNSRKELEWKMWQLEYKTILDSNNIESRTIFELKNLSARNYNNNSIKINVEEMKCIVNNFRDYIENFENDIKNVISTYEKQNEYIYNSIKNEYYKTGEHLDYSEVKDYYTRDVKPHYDKISNQYKEIIKEITSWSNEMSAELKKVYESSEEYEILDKKLKNEFKL